MKNNKQDRKIIEGIKKGGAEQQRAETILFETYHYFVREAASRYALDETERQSAYCDAFMSLLREIQNDRFRGDAGIKTFFYRIFNNRCVDLSRKNTSNKAKVHDTEWVGEWLHLSSRATGALKSLIQQERVQEVQAAIVQLGKKCWAILGAWSKGFSAKEIALALGYKSAQTVMTLKGRCLQKLLKRKEME